MTGNSPEPPSNDIAPGAAIRAIASLILVAEFLSGGMISGALGSGTSGMGASFRALALLAALIAFWNRAAIAAAVVRLWGTDAGRMAVAVTLTTLGAAYLRLSTLRWDLEHGPEGYESLFIRPVIEMMRTGDLNHRYHEYPGLLLYVLLFVMLLTLIAAISARVATGPTDLPEALSLLGARSISAVGSVLSVPAVFVLGRAYAGPRVGLIAAALLAVSPMELRSSQLFRPDVLLELLSLCALRAMLGYVAAPALGSAALAGAAFGVALASKYSGVLLAIPFAGALCAAPGSWPDRWKLGLAAIVAVPLGFLACSPYTLLDLDGFLAGFGAQVAINTTRDLEGVNIPLGYARTLASFSLGLPGLVAAVLGVSWACARPRREDAVLLPWVFGYLLFFFRNSVEGERFLLPVAPVLMIYAAVAAAAVWDAVAARVPARGRRWSAVAACGILFGPPLADAARQWDARRHPSPRGEAAAFVATLPRDSRIAVSRLGPRLRGGNVARLVAIDSDNARILRAFDYLVVSRVDQAAALDGFRLVHRFEARPGGPGEWQEVLQPARPPETLLRPVPPGEFRVAAAPDPAVAARLGAPDAAEWVVPVDGRGRFIEVDLQRPREIARVAFRARPRFSETLRAFTVWLSNDGVTYRRTEPVTLAFDGAEFHLAGTPARFVRFELADGLRQTARVSGLRLFEFSDR